jgi:hypothetical protein
MHATCTHSDAFRQHCMPGMRFKASSALGTGRLALASSRLLQLRAVPLVAPRSIARTVVARCPRPIPCTGPRLMPPKGPSGCRVRPCTPLFPISLVLRSWRRRRLLSNFTHHSSLYYTFKWRSRLERRWDSREKKNCSPLRELSRHSAACSGIRLVSPGPDRAAYPP